MASNLGTTRQQMLSPQKRTTALYASLGGALTGPHRVTRSQCFASLQKRNLNGEDCGLHLFPSPDPTFQCLALQNTPVYVAGISSQKTTRSVRP